MNIHVATLSLLVTCVVLTGCRPEASRVTENATTNGNLATEYLLATEPANPQSLTQVAEKLTPVTETADSETAASETADSEASSETVTLIGKIDAGDFPAFQDGQATFILSELPADGHGLDDPDHEDNCPFCKRRAAKAPKAIVNFVDANGKPLATDARELLGVSQGDRVIAVGTASFDPAVNMITLQCSGIYQSP